MMWLRCFTMWFRNEGVFDEAQSGDLVLVNLQHVETIQSVCEGVSQVMLFGRSCQPLYAAGEPVDVLYRAATNRNSGTAA